MLKRKAEAGAKFVITQPIFEADTARRFLERANEFGLQTIFGILPVKRESMGAYMKKNIADLGNVAGHLDKFAGMSEEQVRRRSIEENLALMQSLATEAAGFNIMSGGGPSLAIRTGTGVYPMAQAKRQLASALRTGADAGRRFPAAPEAEEAVRTLLRYMGEDPGARRTGAHATSSGERVAVPHSRLHQGSQGRDQRRAVQRGRVSGNDPVQGPRFLFALRASHAAVFRQGACRVSAEQAHRRALEARADGGNLRAPAPGAGAPHAANRADHHGTRSSRSASRWCWRPSTCACGCAGSRSRIRWS